MSLTSCGGQEVVRGVERGSPAEAAGVRPGDILLAAGGEASLNLRQIANVLRHCGRHCAADTGRAQPVAAVRLFRVRVRVRVRLGIGLGLGLGLGLEPSP